tara:strand:+ start:980 stop:1471 length:492 start_codon:yes stop_codon:yes gene_type:complete
MTYNLEDLNQRNFAAIEFYRSLTAKKYNIDNVPKEQSTLQNLNLLANKAQEMRDLLGRPMVITSGYRCLELNDKLSASAADSYHLYGLGLDFVVPHMSPREVCKFFKNKILCDKMMASYMWNKKEKRWMRWVHVQFNSNSKQDRNYFLFERIKNGKKLFAKIF